MSRSKTSRTTMSDADRAKAEKNNAAWRMVVERETGKAYHTEWDIKQGTKAGSIVIKGMVARCRMMRRALGTDFDLPVDWWTARLMPLPPIPPRPRDARIDALIAAVTTTSTTETPATAD